MLKYIFTLVRRKDYDCMSITCKPVLLPEYQSNYAKKVNDGEDSVAHLWNCGDYGFTVN